MALIKFLCTRLLICFDSYKESNKYFISFLCFLDLFRACNCTTEIGKRVSICGMVNPFPNFLSSVSI